ncbi:50S ribosomal protein L1 [Candidatus Mikella endobia]|uniref:Large ribosomal subunit protein uL1 n=1 Tax=Candidatus Mikella endobia TaxID=1778264 RepID=A0A143WPN7_9ENTR|nr:50S ribosomal protein L1 [Candidatus Mikella endobia]CUX95756.1 50S ribosomal protein L1 [Candidatus Mikella endobia]
MIKLTKRIRFIQDKVIISKQQYAINSALSLLKELTTANFIESVDVAIQLNIDTRNSDKNIYGTVILPHGRGRNIRVAVFTQGVNVQKAISAGADIVDINKLTSQIKEGNFNFDIIIASPDTMHIVSELGKILVPRNLMPNPKLGTVTTNIAEAVKNIKLGQIQYRTEKEGIVHTTIGKINFDSYKLKENLEALITALKKDKPIYIKGKYIKQISISTTMGVGILVNLDSLFK